MFVLRLFFYRKAAVTEIRHFTLKREKPTVQWPVKIRELISFEKLNFLPMMISEKIAKSGSEESKSKTWRVKASLSERKNLQNLRSIWLQARNSKAPFTPEP